MMHAKTELKALLAAYSENTLVCASITYGEEYIDSTPKVIKLKKGYSNKDFEDFLKELDFEYDDGYGGQELFGTLWFTGGVWATREEYDGSEWWRVNSIPDIPGELQ